MALSATDLEELLERLSRLALHRRRIAGRIAIDRVRLHAKRALERGDGLADVDENPRDEIASGQGKRVVRGVAGLAALQHEAGEIRERVLRSEDGVVLALVALLDLPGDEEATRRKLLAVLERPERLHPESVRAPVPELPASVRSEGDRG